MNFLQELIKETAAAGTTCAHSVASAPGSLFGGGVVRRNSKKKKKKLADAYRFNPATIPTPKSNGQWRIMGEMMDSTLQGQNPESTFDPADVMSKLRDAEKQVDAEDDTVPFGMEDEDGNVVKVFVKAEQAEEFESALASMLSREDDENNEDEITDESEIAEVLFKLKDKFDIVDVKWPEIEGDEEEEQEVQPAQGGEMAGPEGGEMGGEMPGGEGGEPGMEAGAEGEMDMEAGGEEEPDMEAGGGPEATLQQFIDMMKADAEARTAEAEAKAKEAEARAAEAHANASASKVKQEEQVLDAEAHEKGQKDQKTEVDNLAKIARMKHDKLSNTEAQLSAGEEEEESLASMRDFNQQQASAPISTQKLAAELLHRLRGNQ